MQGNAPHRLIFKDYVPPKELIVVYAWQTPLRIFPQPNPQHLAGRANRGLQSHVLVVGSHHWTLTNFLLIAM